MEGRTCVITGANSGVGRETARMLLAEGADVVMLCRNRERAEGARDDIVKTTGRDSVHIVLCDLASFADVRRASNELLERFPRIHVLINNAGGVNTDRRETVDGHEQTLAVNHLAPMLLTHLLKDRLALSSPSRVITLSSGMHWTGRIDFDNLESKAGYSQFLVYANTKLMNVLFARELARRLTGTGVVSNAAHPGFTDTNFGPQRGFLRFGQKLVRPFMISAAQGADTVAWLASAPEAANVTGEYFYHRRVALSSPKSKDPDLARRLWEVSARLVGIA